MNSSLLIVPDRFVVFVRESPNFISHNNANTLIKYILIPENLVYDTKLEFLRIKNHPKRMNLKGGNLLAAKLQATISELSKLLGLCVYQCLYTSVSTFTTKNMLEPRAFTTGDVLYLGTFSLKPFFSMIRKLRQPFSFFIFWELLKYFLFFYNFFSRFIHFCCPIKFVMSDKNFSISFLPHPCHSGPTPVCERYIMTFVKHTMI